MTSWKGIPLRFKILIIYFLIFIILGLFNLPARLQRSGFLFGIIVNPPLSSILTIISIIIPIIVISSIYQKKGWKLVLGLQLFSLLNYIFGAIRILLTPLPQLFAIANRPLPEGASPEALKAIELQTRLVGSIPLLTGAIIGSVILMYIYKKKEYFSDN